MRPGGFPAMAAALAIACVSGRSPEPAIAIVGVSVVPMDSERLLRDQTVVVRGAIVERLGPSSSISSLPGARVVDGTGLFLMPGLVDAHVHLRAPSELLSYLRHGVTTVVHLSGPTSGVPDVLELRRRVRDGAVAGPTILASGRILDGDPPVFPNSSVVVRTAEDARSEAASQITAGFDVIKVYNNLPEASLRAAAAEARRRGVLLFGHIPRAGGREEALQRALAAGLGVIAHGEELFFTFFHAGIEAQLDRGEVPRVAEERLPEAVALTRASGAAVIPNLSFVAMTRAQLDGDVLAEPEARFLEAGVRETWRSQSPRSRRDLARFDLRERAKWPFLRRLTRALQDGGVPLLLGTDASAPGLFPGLSAHLELRELVAAGLTPYQALVTGTRAPGALLGRGRREAPFGIVAAGHRADLLLLRRNPLEDVGALDSLHAVVVRGRLLSVAEVDGLRRPAS